jgi:hypothetical protein
MAKKKKNSVPILRVPKNATLKQIYAIHRKQFSAADLQKFTEIEEGIPIEKIIADMEAIQREETGKRRKKKG